MNIIIHELNSPKLYYIIIIIQELPHQAAIKALYSWLGRRRGEKKKRKRESEEKVVDVSSASLFPARKHKAVTWVETTGIDHPTRRITLGGEARPCGCVPDT